MHLIASRSYDVIGGGSFLAMLFRPHKQPDGSYICKYKLDGPKTHVVGDFGGADELQALLNAVYMIRLGIESSEEYVAGRLSLNGFPGFLDLPDPALHPRNPGLPPLTEPLPPAP